MIKLPNLIEHYYKHKNENSNITIFSFLKMHYLDETVKDADYQQDMSLPFKTHDHSVVSFFSTPPPKLLEISFDIHFNFTEIMKNFSYSDHFTVLEYSRIFHPPKVIG